MLDRIMPALDVKVQQFEGRISSNFVLRFSLRKNRFPTPHIDCYSLTKVEDLEEPKLKQLHEIVSKGVSGGDQKISVAIRNSLGLLRDVDAKTLQSVLVEWMSFLICVYSSRTEEFHRVFQCEWKKFWADLKLKQKMTIEELKEQMTDKKLHVPILLAVCEAFDIAFQVTVNMKGKNVPQQRFLIKYINPRFLSISETVCPVFDLTFDEAQGKWSSVAPAVAASARRESQRQVFSLHGE